jgi:hypothetical protein
LLQPLFIVATTSAAASARNSKEFVLRQRALPSEFPPP